MSNADHIKEVSAVDRTAIIRFAKVRELTGLSGRSTFWRWERDGKFPRRVALPGGGCGWKLSEVLDWIDNLPRREVGKQEAA